MSFSAEIADFVNGFKAGASIGGDIQDRKFEREKWEWDKAFDEKKYADQTARANRALDLQERGLAGKQADRAAREAQRKAAADEKTRARRANEALPDEPGTSKSKKPVYEDEYDFVEGFGDTSSDGDT